MVDMTGFIELVVAGVISFIFGGGAVTLYKAHNENKLRNAERHSIGAKTVPEVTDISISTLVKVNAQLVEDYGRMRAERDDYCAKFETLRDEVILLQGQLDKAQNDLRVAHEATSALRDQLETLMQAMPAPGTQDEPQATHTAEQMTYADEHPRERDFHNKKEEG